MKKKLLPCLFAFLLILFLMPANAFAALPDGVPSSLEAPVIKNIELKYYEDGSPYFEMQIQIPQSILDLDIDRPAGGAVFYDYSLKMDNGSWGEFGGGGYLNSITDAEEAKVSSSANTYLLCFDPLDEGTMEKVDIKNHIYSYKLHFYYDYYEGWPDVEAICSPASNQVSIGSGSFYSAASAWAEPELQKASDLGLIPDILKGTDMTKPITREEFCELAVLLYEKTTGRTATALSTNPFTDTTNQQILKAYDLGITKGKSVTTFKPNMLINREECAAMLFRTINVIAPDGNYSITGINDFPDQIFISSWAVDATKYMSKIGVIKGDNAGNFMPKATTSVQEAAGYGMATREAAVLMTVRTYETIK